MSQSSFPILSLITFAPLAGAMLLLLLPKHSDKEIKLLALGVSIVSLLLTLHVWNHFDANAGMMFEERVPWIPALNVDYHLAVDGLSMAMVLLTAIVTPLALLAHWKQDRNVKLFFFLLVSRFVPVVVGWRLVRRYDYFEILGVAVPRCLNAAVP